MDAPRRRFHRTRKVAGHGGRTVFLTVVFAGALLGSVKIHVDTPRFRRLGQAVGNRILGGTFDGKISLGPITSIALGPRSSIALASVEIVDPDGARVIHGEDVAATIELGTLLRTVLHGPLDVELSDVHIGRADVVLDVDPEGKAKIAKTFTRRKTATTATTPTGTPAAAFLRVHVPPSKIGFATVHGNIVPPALDGDVADAIVEVTVANDHCNVVLERGRVVVRSPRAPNQLVDLGGTATGSIDVALADLGLVGKVDLDGAYGDLPVVAHATMDRGELTAAVDIARTAHPKVHGAFTGLPLSQEVEVHAKASGKLPVLALSTDATLGPGTLHATGEIDLREGYRFRIDADVAHLDAAGLGASLSSDLSGTVHGEGVLQPTPIGTFKVITVPGTVANAVIPATVIEGRFETQHVVATLRATEAGVDAHGKIDVDVPGKLATFDVQARSTALRNLSRAPNLVDGAASVRVEGTVDVAKQTIKAHASASGNGLAFDAFRARSLDATAVIAGPLTAPTLDTTFHAVDLALVAKDKRPLVYPEARGHARVVVVPTPTITNLAVNVTAEGGEPLDLTADRITIQNGAVAASGLKMSGVGAPVELDVHGGNGLWNIRAKSAGIRLRRLGHLTGIAQLKELPEDTNAIFDIDVQQGPSGASGHIDLRVTSEKGIVGAEVTAETLAVIENGKLRGSAKLTAEGIGGIEIVGAELDLPPRLDGASLWRTTGNMDWRGTIDLSRGAALVAGESVERVGGTAILEGRIERTDPAALPLVRTTIRTEGLEIVYGDPASSAKSTTITGIDLLTHLAWDGRTNATELAIVSWDRHGLLASGGVKSRVPLAGFLTGKENLDDRALGALEVDALVTLPQRILKDLPELFRPAGVQGLVAGQIHVGGALAHPRVAVSARVTNLREDAGRTGTAARTLQPVDGVLEARWDGEHAGITFALDERERAARKRAPQNGGPLDRPRTPRKPSHVRGLVVLDDLRMVDVLRGVGLDELPWKANGEIELDAMNLAAVPVVSGVGLQGTLSCRLSLRDVHRAGSFDLKAHVDDFGAGGAKVQSLDLIAGGRNASLYARATIEDATGTDASEAIVQLVSQSPRVEGLAIGWDQTSPTRIDYGVRNMRLALLTPLFKSTISELDGRANGAGSIAIDEKSQVFDGGLAVTGGRLYLNALGEEVTSLDAIARFDKSGSWRIDDASGKMGTGEFKASADGHLKGLQFVDAQAKLVANRNIPISSEAATFAEATGEVSLSAKMSDDRKDLLVSLEVPKTNVQLPDRSAQRLQPLDPDTTVTVGVRRGAKLDSTVVRRGMGGTGVQRSGAAATAASEKLVTQVTVSLGKEVHLEGRGLDVKLGGKTLVELADEVRVTGVIDLRSGTIEVHGRRFTVDRGTVTFPDKGDPANPTVIAAAYWDSPDRTRVWVEFTGPLKTGKLSLRSEPAYSKNEILSVLLFGRPDPNMATGGGDQTGDASGATAVGTGFVANDLNLMLSEIDDNLDIETDTLSGNRARTKLGRSFFDRRLKVQVGYAPGRTYREPDTTYVFLNWQFIPQWSVVATRGDRGTSILDVLFQHRY